MTTHVLALTMGDPAGIGPEITAKTLAEVGGEEGHHGVVVGDPAALRRGAEAMGLDVTVRVVDDFSTPKAGPDVLDVFDTGVLGDDLPAWGEVDERAGQAAVTAIEVATRAAMDGDAAGIVTGPINKEAIWATGSEFLGHTEMLGHLTGVTKQDTMFVLENPAADDHRLQIFFTTRHVSLRVAVEQLRDKELILDSTRRAYRALQVFGIENPRLAVAALNPHGGEGGHFGDEEIEFIAPAVEAAKAEGLDVHGPIPADSVFHQGLQGRYDGILSHFHDQGHIPSKTFDFDGTISVTVGLPILRTSVDHGTAFDIAGTGRAGHGTMLSAYRAGVGYAPFADRIRQEYGTS